MHDALTHALEHRFAARKSIRRAADHECERCRLGAANAAGDRRVERGDAALRGEPMRGARAGHVDGRAVDKQGAALCRWQNFAPDRAHMLARRQHGDHDVGALDRGFGVRRDRDAELRTGRPRRVDDVEADHMVAGFDQIGGHRRPILPTPMNPMFGITAPIRMSVPVHRRIGSADRRCPALPLRSFQVASAVCGPCR